MRLHQLLDQYLAGAWEKIHLARMNVVQVFGGDPHFFRTQIAAHEIGIAFAHIHRAKSAQHITAAEYLGLHVFAPRAGLQQLVDQHLHRVGAITHRRRYRAVAVARPAVGQHEVVHAADTGDAIENASRYA